MAKLTKAEQKRLNELLTVVDMDDIGRQVERFNQLNEPIRSKKLFGMPNKGRLTEQPEVSKCQEKEGKK